MSVSLLRPHRQRLQGVAERLLGFEGIAETGVLPDDEARARWDSIHLAGDAKERILRHAQVTLALRQRTDTNRVPLHGIIVLAGPPGTGKTTLAAGLGSPLADALNEDLLYIEVNAHKLGSGALGRTQKQVDQLFSETIPSAVGTDYALVVVDEVEVLATARAKLSLDANPVDVHRAVDAALVGIDRLARNHPKTLIVATTNFEGAIDEAFLSRADLVMTVPVPDRAGREIILRDTLEAVGGLDQLLTPEVVGRVAVAADGIDARQLRKSVVAALARRPETVGDFSKLTEADLMATVAEALRG